MGWNDFSVRRVDFPGDEDGPISPEYELVCVKGLAQDGHFRG